MASLTKPQPNHTCPRCGGPNACAPARSGSFETPCWCREVKVSPHALVGLGDEQRLACVCARCAQAGAQASTEAPMAPPTPTAR